MKKSLACVVALCAASTFTIGHAYASANAAAWNCGPSNLVSNVIGVSQISPGFASSKDSDDLCGTMKVRMYYRLYPGSATYLTGWVQNSTYAVTAPGNTGISSQHAWTGSGINYSSGSASLTAG